MTPIEFLAMAMNGSTGTEASNAAGLAILSKIMKFSNYNPDEQDLATEKSLINNQINRAGLDKYGMMLQTMGTSPEVRNAAANGLTKHQEYMTALQQQYDMISKHPKEYVRYKLESIMETMSKLQTPQLVQMLSTDKAQYVASTAQLMNAMIGSLGSVSKSGGGSGSGENDQDYMLKLLKQLQETAAASDDTYFKNNLLKIVADMYARVSGIPSLTSDTDILLGKKQIGGAPKNPN